jgi:hypothetical protein
VTEDEIEIVAEELVKAGGLAWHPGRERGRLLKVVSDRYREHARLVIAALNRYRAQEASAPSTDRVEDERRSTHTEARAASNSAVQPGATVVYRPPGEQRAYPCRVEKIEGGQAYLVPHLRGWTGWVPKESLSLAQAKEDALGRGAIEALAPQRGLSMTDEEVEVVAAELAKAGGVSWHSGQERGPLKLVMNRFRDRARQAIATLERFRAAKQAASSGEIKVAQPVLSIMGKAEALSHDPVSAGSLVLYRPPGDKRTYPCRIERVEGTRVFLVPELPTCTGWVDLANLSSPAIQ